MNARPQTQTYSSQFLFRLGTVHPVVAFTYLSVMFDLGANTPTLSSQVFAYDPLSSPASIRLLKVLPKQDDCRIQIELWEQVQIDPKPYRCLSYTWGESLATSSVRVNGRSMEVGNNLYAFLVVASQRFANETLWIDAISINQSDNTEKGHQVQSMGDV